MACTAVIAQNAGVASVIEWAKLALTAPQARVLRVTRIRYDDADRAVAFEEVVLALDCFPDRSLTAGEIPEIFELAERHGISLGRSSERISMVQASKGIASHLGIVTGANVLKMDRIAETADGRPIEWRVAFCRT
jgi:DNA-binding GntR family transcriptional regulator